MTEPIKLPPLPEPDGYIRDGGPKGILIFQRDPLSQTERMFHSTDVVWRSSAMQSYARAAIEADRQDQAITYANQYLSLTDAMGYESDSALSPEEWAANLLADRKTAEKQLTAYKGLVSSMEARLSRLQAQHDELKKSANPDLLASERAANAMLTEELEAMRKRIGEPELVGWAVGVDGGGFVHASTHTEAQANRAGYSLPLYRLRTPQPQQQEIEPCWIEETTSYMCTGDCPYTHTQWKRQRGLLGQPVSPQPHSIPEGFQPFETIKYWVEAYSNPEGDEHFMGHGMVVQLLKEYAQLRAMLEAAPSIDLPEVQALRDALQEVIVAADGTGWDQLDPGLEKQRAALAAMEK